MKKKKIQFIFCLGVCETCQSVYSFQTSAYLYRSVTCREFSQPRPFIILIYIYKFIILDSSSRVVFFFVWFFTFSNFKNNGMNSTRRRIIIMIIIEEIIIQKQTITLCNRLVCGCVGVCVSVYSFSIWFILFYFCL